MGRKPKSVAFDARLLGRAIVHPDDKNCVQFAIPLSDTEQGESLQLADLMSGHKFRALYAHKLDHPFAGEIEMTPTDLQNMKRNFEDRLLNVDVAIDYSHESWGPASGWVRSVELSADNSELWLTVAWTKRGAQALLDREFKYFSAEFYLDYAAENGNRYGKTLVGGALTNRPFLKRLGEVIQKSDDEEEYSSSINGSVENPTISLSEENMPADSNKALEELRSENEKLRNDVTKLSEVLKGGESIVAERDNLKAQLDDLQKKAAEAAKDREFDKLKTQYGYNESQRDAFKKGDVLEFAKLFKPLNVRPTEQPDLSAQNQTSDDDVKFSQEDERACERYQVDPKFYKEAMKYGQKLKVSVFEGPAK